jgi:tRNA (guanine-N7-)-methyltransferase
MTLNYKRIVSFARKRSGNPKREAEILHQLLPKYAALTHEDGGPLIKISECFGVDGVYDSYAMEIGFGSGENLLHIAKQSPRIGFIGCEVFTAGAVKLLKDLEDNNINNVRIWHDDALDLLVRLPNESLDLLYILHPDPWPKTRHNKRRLINENFLRFIVTKISNAGKVFMVTDHQDYANHINKVLLEVQDIYDISRTDFPEFIKTKYRLKAEAQGVESHHYLLVKK